MSGSDGRETGLEPKTEELSLNEIRATSTRPQTGTAAPTTTLTQRPWTVLITLAVSVLCTVALAVVNAFGRYNTAEMTLAKLVKALNAADVDTLLEDPEMGFRERAERDMSQRGFEEYNQILSAFGTCETAGLEQYRTLKQTVMLRGEEAFKKLPGETQRAIRAKSKDDWMVANGLEVLGKEGNRGISDAASFQDPEKARMHVLRLGLEELEARGEENLPGIDEVLSWKKPKTSQKALLGKIDKAGQEAFERLHKDATSAGLKRFKSLTPRERKAISSASYKLWVVTKGVELLDEQDRELVTSPEMFLDTTDEEAEARRLCLLILPAAQKTLIEGRNYEDFMAKRDDYIRSTGRERYERFLKALFRTCKYEIVDSDLSGDDPYDLLKISTATFTLHWNDCPGAAKFLGEELSFHFENGSWRFQPTIEQDHEEEKSEQPPTEDEAVDEDEEGDP